MKTRSTRIYSPVKRSGAEYYLLITLLSFAASVTLTRIFLFLAGYPQLGGGGLHIAHVLWGGLILFIAALLPLIFSNRWVYLLGAILTGIGVGLFIDEVGKFITQDNNYFYPPAATIIYAFFLLTVLIYFQVRRRPPRNPRLELYQALETLEEVLDHDLDPKERLELEARFLYVAQQSERPDLARLAQELLDFLNSEDIQLSPPPNDSVWQRSLVRLRNFMNLHLTRPRFRAILAVGIGVMGLVGLSKLGQTLIAGFAPAPLANTLNALVELGILSNASGLFWFLLRVALEGAVGLMMCASAVLIALKKDRLGIWGSYLSLLISLTTVNLLLFYYEQFSMIATASFQLILLLAVLIYRQRFLMPTSLS